MIIRTSHIPYLIPNTMNIFRAPIYLFAALPILQTGKVSARVGGSLEELSSTDKRPKSYTHTKADRATDLGR
ncbi:hypothetical protein HJC23_002609 [Cyclotella cryptica]|uniref:Uncharacterized protein n=1 Tax=Cyclotella cryptica TaxID=29204 RepID=A0ABD3PYG4_9STRA